MDTTLSTNESLLMRAEIIKTTSNLGNRFYEVKNLCKEIENLVLNVVDPINFDVSLFDLLRNHAWKEINNDGERLNEKIFALFVVGKQMTEASTSHDLSSHGRKVSCFSYSAYAMFLYGIFLKQSRAKQQYNTSIALSTNHTLFSRLILDIDVSGEARETMTLQDVKKTVVGRLSFIMPKLGAYVVTQRSNVKTSSFHMIFAIHLDAVSNISLQRLIAAIPMPSGIRIDPLEKKFLPTGRNHRLTAEYETTNCVDNFHLVTPFRINRAVPFYTFLERFKELDVETEDHTDYTLVFNTKECIERYGFFARLDGHGVIDGSYLKKQDFFVGISNRRGKITIHKRGEELNGFDRLEQFSYMYNHKAIIDEYKNTRDDKISDASSISGESSNDARDPFDHEEFCDLYFCTNLEFNDSMQNITNVNLNLNEDETVTNIKNNMKEMVNVSVTSADPNEYATYLNFLKTHYRPQTINKTIEQIIEESSNIRTNVADVLNMLLNHFLNVEASGNFMNGLLCMFFENTDLLTHTLNQCFDTIDGQHLFILNFYQHLAHKLCANLSLTNIVEKWNMNFTEIPPYNFKFYEKYRRQLLIVLKRTLVYSLNLGHITTTLALLMKLEWITVPLLSAVLFCLCLNDQGLEEHVIYKLSWYLTKSMEPYLTAVRPDLVFTNDLIHIIANGYQNSQEVLKNMMCFKISKYFDFELITVPGQRKRTKPAENVSFNKFCKLISCKYIACILQNGGLWFIYHKNRYVHMEAKLKEENLPHTTMLIEPAKFHFWYRREDGVYNSVNQMYDHHSPGLNSIVFMKRPEQLSQYLRYENLSFCSNWFKKNFIFELVLKAKHFVDFCHANKTMAVFLSSIDHPDQSDLRYKFIQITSNDLNNINFLYFENITQFNVSQYPRFFEAFKIVYLLICSLSQQCDLNLENVSGFLEMTQKILKKTENGMTSTNIDGEQPEDGASKPKLGLFAQKILKDDRFIDCLRKSLSLVQPSQQSMLTHSSVELLHDTFSKTKHYQNLDEFILYDMLNGKITDVNMFTMDLVTMSPNLFKYVFCVTSWYLRCR